MTDSSKHGKRTRAIVGLEQLEQHVALSAFGPVPGPVPPPAAPVEVFDRAAVPLPAASLPAASLPATPLPATPRPAASIAAAPRATIDVNARHGDRYLRTFRDALANIPGLTKRSNVEELVVLGDRTHPQLRFSLRVQYKLVTPFGAVTVKTVRARATLDLNNVRESDISITGGVGESARAKRVLAELTVSLATDLKALL